MSQERAKVHTAMDGCCSKWQGFDCAKWMPNLPKSEIERPNLSDAREFETAISHGVWDLEVIELVKLREICEQAWKGLEV